jgi:hypothetical protein
MYRIISWQGFTIPSFKLLLESFNHSVCYCTDVPLVIISIHEAYSIQCLRTESTSTVFVYRGYATIKKPPAAAGGCLLDMRE